MNFKIRSSVYRLVAITIAVCLPLARAEDKVTQQQTQDANLKSYVNLLRADIKKAKVSIITELMDLTPEDAEKFWPVYNEYNRALTQITDERLAAIKMYADNYRNITDEKITQITHALLDVEGRRAELKKVTFESMSQRCSAKLAARFLQIENQLEKIIDLQIAASLPIVE
jgi:hypothetical protein